MEGSLLWALILAVISKQGYLRIGMIEEECRESWLLWSLETGGIKAECRKLC